MDVREKLVKICFREFCDIAGDSPCGCDGCPYGEYEHDNGGCFDEYKKDKIEKLENDMDKYQKEDNGVTVQEWISVKDRLPTIYDADADNCVLAIHKATNKRYYHWRSVANNPFDFTHWMKTPQPPKGE